MGGSEVQHHPHYAVSSRTSLVLQENLSRKGSEGGRRQEREVVSCCCFTQLSESPGRLSRTGFLILSFEVWVALEPQKLRFPRLAQDSFGTYASQLPTWRSICHS